MTATPRRTCPACQRRYGGVVARDCPLCDGLGVMPLGAAALHLHPAPVIARAVELYLEHHATRAINTMPPGEERRAYLTAAADDLRHAGLLYGPADSTRTGTSHVDPPPDPTGPATREQAAHAYTAHLDAPTTTHQLAALDTPPAADLAAVKPRTGLPTGSANGHRAALATIADEIDALGPDAAVLNDHRHANELHARVTATATADAAHRRRQTRRENRP